MDYLTSDRCPSFIHSFIHQSTNPFIYSAENDQKYSGYLEKPSHYPHSFPRRTHPSVQQAHQPMTTSPSSRRVLRVLTYTLLLLLLPVVSAAPKLVHSQALDVASLRPSSVRGHRGLVLGRRHEPGLVSAIFTTKSVNGTSPPGKPSTPYLHAY